MFMMYDEVTLLAWKWVDDLLPIERTALDFADDLAASHWLTARYELSLELQTELSPAELKSTWTKLRKHQTSTAS